LGTVYRIDPVTGGKEELIIFPEGANPRLADFSPEGDRLYVGTWSEQGTIWVIDLDANFRVNGGMVS
jgi:sugar lactone lactonase YvrE